MRAARLTLPMDRVFLTKKGDHFEKIAQRSPYWFRQREKLFEHREESLAYIHKLVSLAAEEKPEFSMHPGDAATDTFDRDLTLSLVSFEQEKLYEIEATLRRIDDGTYGVCELTGQPISAERLNAIPWTRFCVAAEQLLGATNHPHIGMLNPVRIIADNASDDCAVEATEIE